MAFNLLSLELNEQIAISLDTDRQVCDFRLICHATNAAVRTYRCGVWRDRYAQRYDMPLWKGGRETEMQYKLRSRLLRKSAKFLMGQELREISCMKVLRDLIVESFCNVPIGRKAELPSNNLNVIQEFVQRSGMLRKSVYCLEGKNNINPLLQTLQLVLTHMELEFPSIRASPIMGFAYSQTAVYSHPNDFPMFCRNDFISTNLLLHIVNFFKHHLTQKGEGTLYNVFSQLETHEKPKAWNARLVQGCGVQKLGKHWKGTYAYLHDLTEMDLIRRCEPGKEFVFIDSIDHQDGLQTLVLDFEPEANRARWPKVFESHLNAMPSQTLCHRLDNVYSPTRRRGSGGARSGPRAMTAASNRGNPHRVQAPEEPLSPPGTPGVNRADIDLPRPQTTKPAKPRSPTSPTLPKRGVHYHQFNGYGNDAEPFRCSGILHPLPPQQEIPGWYRISMMKYFDPLVQADGTPPQSNSTWATVQSEGNTANVPSTGAGADYNVGDKYQIDDDAQINTGCWAYEGVVLPGGMIMLGRWWSPMDDMGEKRCMGPFIFWNVDKED